MKSLFLILIALSCCYCQINWRALFKDSLNHVYSDTVDRSIYIGMTLDDVITLWGLPTDTLKPLSLDPVKILFYEGNAPFPWYRAKLYFNKNILYMIREE